jgi:hypothetical protein
MARGQGMAMVGRLTGRTSARRSPGVRCWFASRAVSRPAYRGRGAARHRVWEVPGGLLVQFVQSFGTRSRCRVGGVVVPRRRARGWLGIGLGVRGRA